MYLTLPTYAELVHDFPGYGFGGLVISETDFPLIAAKKGILTMQFYEIYCDRRINRETVQLWQLKLQTVFDRIAEKHERGYRLYSANKADVDKAIEGVYNEAKNGESDTPDSDLSSSDPFKYAGRVSRAERTSKVTGASAMQSLNSNIQSYEDRDVAFLDEFERCFMAVLE